MPRLLALDTSSEACSIALLDGDVCNEHYVEAPREQMLRVLPMVDALLAEHALTLRNIDAIAFTRGPGSFTGLRIGMGVVQGLAFGADLPVIPVSTLAALAQTSAAQHGVGTHILSAIDARMDEVYWGWYQISVQGLVEAIGTEQLSAPEAVARGDGAAVRIGVGSGWQYRPRIADAGFATIDAALLPHAAAVLQLALPIWHAGGAVAVEQVQPVYLREKVV